MPFEIMFDSAEETIDTEFESTTQTPPLVQSVAGKVGVVTLDAGDVGYAPTDTYASGTVGAAVSDSQDGHVLQPLLFGASGRLNNGSNSTYIDPVDYKTGYVFNGFDRVTDEGVNTNFAIFRKLDPANFIPALTSGQKMTIAMWAELASGVSVVETRQINLFDSGAKNTSSYKWAGNDYYVLHNGWNLMELAVGGTGGSNTVYEFVQIRCATLARIQGIKSLQIFLDGKATPANCLPLDTPVATEILAGKKWAVCGDSFTAGADSGTLDSGTYAGQKIVYPYIIGNRTGINVLKFFENGRTLAMPATPGDFVNSLCATDQDWYYQNIPADVDYITIQLGINDHHHAPDSSGDGDGEDTTGEIPIGTISDNTTATYYGAWNVVLSWLMENRPFAHIGMIVTNGVTAPYRTAQLDIAQKYGIPYIDLNGDSRTPVMIRSCNPDVASAIKTLVNTKQRISSTNTHPNNNAHRYMATFIENFLRTL